MKRRGETDDGPRLSIGALSRATGVPVETLRTWEARYGFPVPERKPSGHRVYPTSSIPRLLRIAEALARGHRAGQVVAASDAALDELLQSTPSAPAPAAAPPALRSTGDLLDHVARFDADRLTRALLGEWARRSPVEFAADVIAPLVREAGIAWAERRLEIRHEHFLSERVGDLLRSLRLPLEERARGPLVVLASLPGESHSLGLQMVALVLAAAGCRLLFLGTEVPPEQMAALARDLGARALGLSVSSATGGATANAQLRRLRAALPRRVQLLVGGAGAPKKGDGLEILTDLRALDAWARERVARAESALA
jgi:DNA-binding transcriptional MerR regulator/methylmalonyl-CoA mutase cobalamin-binding subunit